MNLFERIDNWTERHHSIWMDVLRIGLGAVLILKGLEFGRDPKEIDYIITNSPFDPISFILIHYIVMAHLTGGLLIMCGLFTRFAILIQLPIVVGAVFLVRSSAVFSFFASQGQAMAVLVLMIVFLFYGAGSFSMDEHIKQHPVR